MDWLIENVDLQLKLISSLLLILIAVLLRPLSTAIVGRRTEDPAVLYRWRKASEYSALVIIVVGLSSIWLAGVASLITYLGLLSAGLAIALQDPITNLVGWLFIIWRRPFEVGDRIQVGERAGDVIDIRFFQFTLVEIGNWVDADQSTGRLLHVPNRKVFIESVANYSNPLQPINLAGDMFTLLLSASSNRRPSRAGSPSRSLPLRSARPRSTARSDARSRPVRRPS